jgi:hypothetical protein
LASITAAKNRLPWWVGPITVSTVLVLFTVYAMYVVFFRPDGQYQSLLSPFYSPPVGIPGWMPGWVTAPMLVLWIPLGFRATCYYYRKAYYRAFFWDPPACSSKAQEREPRGNNYNGERALFILNNIHRYFLYGSIIVVAFLWYETAVSFFPEGGFGMTIGSLVLLTNIVLLSGYTFSCHSFRHLVGGNKDCYSCVKSGGSTGSEVRSENFLRKLRRKTYNGVSVINGQHASWAWASLFMLLIADLYIRLLQAGVITDLRIF